MRKERHDRKRMDRVNKLSASLHTEHEVGIQLAKALQVQMVINEALRERIEELENK